MLYGDTYDETESKKIFIESNMESGCKVASATDEYINIKINRKKLIEKLLLYVSSENMKNAELILNDIDATYNQQSSIEFDCVLGLLFDKINMLPELISVNSLKNTSKEMEKKKKK